MKQITNKIKDGILFGIGFALVIGITSLSYAAFSWITQTPVAGGETLTATKWNDMLNNQNYLKENTETKVSKAGDTMAGPINMGTNKITNLGVPVASTDAATKSYADSVSASTSGGVAYCETRNTYTGNLGGLSGADAKCASDCGTGYKFASYGDLTNFASSRSSDGTWVFSVSNNCNNRTLGTRTGVFGLMLSSINTIGNGPCHSNYTLACIKY